ncbi:MAG: hypothetical protein HY868_17715 [Chloroflexi bacterium]|nr:hypothetical protein [Chloroflexota bacterium]
MKRLTIFLVLTMLAATAAGCNPSSSPAITSEGPRVWLDAPLNDSAFPLAPLEVISHSSDPLQVTQVELNVNGNILRTDPNPDQAKTLVTMRQKWSPPAPGNYTLMVRAQNSASVWSDYALTVVTIGGVTTPTPPTPPRPGAPTPTATNTPPIQVAKAGDTRTPLSPASIAFSADQTNLVAGQCATLRWETKNVAQVFLGNTSVGASGAKQECPTKTTSYTLRVVTLDSQVAQRTVTINVVSPSITPTRTATLTRTPTRTPTKYLLAPPIQGCNGAPVIASFSASPTSITSGGSSTLNWGAVTNADSVEINQGIGGVAAPGSIKVSPKSTTTYTLTARCGSNTVTRQVTVSVALYITIPDKIKTNTPTPTKPPTDTTGPTFGSIYPVGTYFYRSYCNPTSITINATASDSSGVANVTLYYRVGTSGAYASRTMDSIGSNNYRETIKSSDVAGNSTGTFYFYVIARDTRGNSRQSSTNSSVRLIECVR